MGETKDSKPTSQDGTIYRDVTWWSCHLNGETPDRYLVEHIRTMRARQSTRYLNMRRLISMYEFGFRAASYDNVDEQPVHEQVNTYNAAQNVLDTVHAKICKSRIIPMPLTSGGGALQRRRAKDLGKALEGEFDENHVDQVKEDVVQDALICGAGFAKVFSHFGRVKVEHVPTEDITIDDVEARYRKPRSFYHSQRLDRFVVLDTYGGRPQEEDGADEANKGLHGTVSERRAKILQAPSALLHGSTAGWAHDQIDVHEAWHLRSSPDAKDGRHTLCIDGCTLLDEQWDGEKFPFASYVPRKRRRHMWGLSGMQQLAPAQHEFEKITRRIQRAHQKLGGSHIIAPRSANVDFREIDNDQGTAVDYDGQVPPKEWNPEPVAAQTYQYAGSIPENMSRHFGISGLSTSSEIPAGLQQASGKALQVFDDVEAERLRAYHSELDRWHLEIADLIIHEARALVDCGSSYCVRYKAKRAIEAVDWKKVLLDEEDYVLHVFPVSILARSPAAKFEQLQELLNAGVITVEQFRRLYDLPDLEAETEIDTADTDIIDRNLDIIVVKKQYLPPEPFDNLHLAKSRAAKFYNVCRQNEVPEARLKMLRNYILDCDAELERTAPAPASPPMPGPGLGAPVPPEPSPPGLPGPGSPPPMPPMPDMPPMNGVPPPSLAA